MNIAYRVVKDRFGNPLVVIEGSLGNGLEVTPYQLQKIASSLFHLAAEASTYRLPHKGELTV